MTRPKVVEVDYGIASAYSDGVIEINRKINGNLREKILTHEFSHTIGQGYTKKDYDTDFNSRSPYFFESLKFCIHNLEGFINFMPVLYSYRLKQWTFNFTALIPFFLWGFIFSTITWLLLKQNFFLASFAWLNIIVSLNIAAIIYTHFYVKKKVKLY